MIWWIKLHIFIYRHLYTGKPDGTAAVYKDVHRANDITRTWWASVQPADAAACCMCSSERRADIMKALCDIRNAVNRQPMRYHVYLLEEHSCQISSWSDLKRRSLGLFWSVTKTATIKMSRDMRASDPNIYIFSYRLLFSRLYCCMQYDRLSQQQLSFWLILRGGVRKQWPKMKVRFIKHAVIRSSCKAADSGEMNLHQTEWKLML